MPLKMDCVVMYGSFYYSGGGLECLFPSNKPNINGCLFLLLLLGEHADDVKEAREHGLDKEVQSVVFICASYLTQSPSQKCK